MTEDFLSKREKIKAPSHGLAYLRLPPPQTPANMEGVGFLEAGGAGWRHRMLLMPRYRDIAISRFFNEVAAATGRQLPVRCRRRWIRAHVRPCRACAALAARPSTKMATEIQLPQCGGYDGDIAVAVEVGAGGCCVRVAGSRGAEPCHQNKVLTGARQTKILQHEMSKKGRFHLQ